MAVSSNNNNNSCIPAQKLDFLCTITFYGLTNYRYYLVKVKVLVSCLCHATIPRVQTAFQL